MWKVRAPRPSGVMHPNRQTTVGKVHRRYDDVSRGAGSRSEALTSSHRARHQAGYRTADGRLRTVHLGVTTPQQLTVRTGRGHAVADVGGGMPSRGNSVMRAASSIFDGDRARAMGDDRRARLLRSVAERYDLRTARTGGVVPLVSCSSP